MWHELPWGINDVAPDQIQTDANGNIRCCIRGCSHMLNRAHRGQLWNDNCFCPNHLIRVSLAPTWIYKRDEYARNFIVDRGILNAVLPYKTETWRLGNEKSEDALTWNMFVGLQRLGQLRAAIKTLTGISPSSEPELYLWGIRIENEVAGHWQKLIETREFLEDGLQIKTEPDIILRVPGELLVVIEAKFGSPNSTLDRKDYETAEEFLEVYSSPRNMPDVLNHDWIRQQPTTAVLEQLCRMAVFSGWMKEGKERVVVVNLLRQNEMRDGIPNFQPHLNPSGIVQFSAKTWEDLIPLADNQADNTLSRYLAQKTYELSPAFGRAI